MKIDFHIHTISNQYLDKKFEFDKRAMIAYIHNNSFEAIAITNHNKFDKLQFQEIIELLKDECCIVLPGIEISLEGGHILVIGDNTNIDIEKLDKISEFISLKEKDDQYKMSIDEFNSFIGEENDFLIIPHYLKKPKVPEEILKKIKIFVGEVQNPKKFYLMKKEKRFTPVLFSDIRIRKTNDNEFDLFYSNVTGYTYLNCETRSFKSIKKALMNVDSTSLTDDFNDNLFEVMNGETKAYTGINVLLGKRSSGKTFTLDHIYGQGNFHTLYIRQFDIIKKCESVKFESFLEKDNEETIIEFLQEMNAVFDYINGFSPFEIESELFDYLKSLKDSAEQNLEDQYSKTPLFKNNFINELDNQADKIYKSLDVLLSASKEYKETIFKILPKEGVEKLYRRFLKEARDTYLNNLLIRKTKDISDIIGKQLESNSAKIRIKQIDFKKIFKYLYIREKFDFLINSMGKEEPVEIITRTLFNKFILTIEMVRETNKAKMKTKLKIPKEGNIDCLLTGSPFMIFFNAKKNDQIKIGFGEERYKLFFTIKREVKTTYKSNLSGGQRAEFILLSELDNYRSYDLILIDEMESSFDNPFLNNEIIAQIKKMANDAIVFISTHNNNLGVSLNPDYYIYHELVIDEAGRQLYKKYFGSSTSKELISKDGSSIELSRVLITTMEANNNAYNERKEKYENS